MNVQGDFSALFYPGLRKDFLDSYEAHTPVWNRYLKSGTMDTPTIRATIMAGPNRLYERGDGEPVQYDIARQGPVVQGVDREFALGFLLSKKTVEDDLYDKANQASKWLGRATQLTYEFRAAELLDDAFAGSTFLGIDGLPLMSTAHTLLGSTSTVANTPTSQVGLSMTGIQALQNLQMNMKDWNGDPIVSMAQKLVIGNSAGMLNRARQIFGVGGNKAEPFTANNQDNAMKAQFGEVEIVVNPYMVSNTNYFMIDEKLNDAHLLMRRAATMDNTFDFDTDAAKYKVTTRFLIWFVDWHGWTGSNPT
jgi:hypothetical protein